MASMAAPCGPVSGSASALGTFVRLHTAARTRIGVSRRIFFLRRRDGRAFQSPPPARTVTRRLLPKQRSERRAPRRRHHAIAGLRLLDTRESRERIVAALHPPPVRAQK